MSTRLRSSKRTRQSAGIECTPSSSSARERNKRERRKPATTTTPAAAAATDAASTTSSSSTTVATDAALITTITTTATTPTTSTTTTARASGRCFEHDAAAATAVEKVDIKVEPPFDLTSDGEVEAIDVKPDVHQLQQALLLQQQQQDVLPAGALLSSTAATAALPTPQPGGGKRVYIIGDLATLTSLANSGSSIALGCLPGASDGSGATAGVAAGAGVGGVDGGSCSGIGMGDVANLIGGGCAPNGATMPAITGGTQALASAVTPSPMPPLSAKTLAAAAAAAMAAATSTTITPKAKTISDAASFAKDEFDLQESDVDEDGYSDIDFDEDDDFIEDDTEFDLYDPHWSDQPTGPRLVFPFDWQPNDLGLEGRPKSTNPLFYFNKLLGDFGVFFGLLATGTNERVHQLFDVEAADTEPCIKEEITADDVRCFVALCLQMSQLQLPTLGEYWSEQAHCGFTGFGGVMSEQRFRLIMHTLNFEHIGQGSSVPTLLQPRDPLVEVRPLLEFFNQRMTDIYTCGQRLVLNEPIVYWQGRCQWQRAMSEHFRCNAVSLHFLTEFSGLVLRIAPDVDGADRKQLTRNSKLLAQHRVMLAKELLHGKFGHGYTVYASKYYGSCGLAYELANERTYCTGMLDNRRYGNCKQLVLNPLKECAFAVKYASPIMMGKWRRREKCVYFYSSDCLAIYVNETAWRSRDRRPKIIKEMEWQLQLSEPIRHAMVHYQPTIERKDMPWHRHLSIYILNVMMLNAYILYKMYAPIVGSRVTELHLKDTSKLRSYAEFRQYVIGWLLGTIKEDEPDEAAPTLKSKRAQKRSHGSHALDAEDGTERNGEADESAAAAAAQDAAAKQMLELKHTLKEVPRRNGKTLKRKCRICRKGGMLTLTKYCCDVCPGTPGLCDTPCFGIWHDQLKQQPSKDGARGKVRELSKTHTNAVSLY